MPPREDHKADLIRILHMLDAANEAVSFLRDLERAALKEDRRLALALTKELEIIGEAASKVSETRKAEHPEIPWEAIIATRNRLIHGYFDIDLDIVWVTVTKDLPDLIRKLKPVERTLKKK